MTPDDPRAIATRVRHRIAQNLALVVVACLLLAGAGGFVAFEEATAPDTTTEQRTVATWTTDSEFTHQATVQRSTQAFDSGTVLRNRSAYLLGITPELQATHVYHLRGDAEAATVTTNVTLVKRAVDPTATESTEYWRVTEPVVRQETTLTSGESTRTTFTVNVSEQQNQSRQIGAELGGTPGEVQLFALVTTRIETTVEGQQRQRVRTERLTLEPRGTTYAVVANTSGERSEEFTEAASVPVESNPLRTYGGALFALLSLGAAGGLVLADRQGRLALSGSIVAVIVAERERDRFDEWISRGAVPELAEADSLVRVESLEDLVDVAIDSDRRVIEDTDADQFVVIVDGTRYVYESTVDHGDPAGPVVENTPSDPADDE